MNTALYVRRLLTLFCTVWEAQCQLSLLEVRAINCCFWIYRNNIYLWPSSSFLVSYMSSTDHVVYIYGSLSYFSFSYLSVSLCSSLLSKLFYVFLYSTCFLPASLLIFSLCFFFSYLKWSMNLFLTGNPTWESEISKKKK